ncbi:MAG: hypothetical protein V5A64_02425 [Candidatus Thermoplasmatota archaeon]
MGSSRRNNLKKILVYSSIILILFSINNALVSASDTNFKFALDTRYDGGSYRAVYCDESFVYTACYDQGIKVYNFDGNNFYLSDRYKPMEDTFCLDVDGDGEYVYSSWKSNGLKVFSVKDGKLVLEDIVSDGATYRGVYSKNGLVFAACDNGGLKIFDFDGDKLSLKTERDDGGKYLDVFYDNVFVYTCGNDGLKAYHLKDNRLELVDTQKKIDGSVGWYWDVYCNKDLVYVACDYDGLKIFRFNGQQFEFLVGRSDGGRYLDVLLYGNKCYTGCYGGEGGIKKYSLQDKKLVLENSSKPFNCYGIYSDKSFLYTAAHKEGIKVFQSAEKDRGAEFLFDVTLSLSKVTVSEGKNIKAIVELTKKEGKGEADGLLTYSLYDSNGEQIWMDQDSTSTLVTNALTKLIPTGSFEPGEYTFKVVQKYGDNQKASAQTAFKIKEQKTGFWSPYMILFFVILFCMGAGIFLWFSKNKFLDIKDKKEVKTDEEASTLVDQLRKTIPLEHKINQDNREVIKLYNSRENQRKIKRKLMQEKANNLVENKEDNDRNEEFYESLYNFMKDKPQYQFIEYETDSYQQKNFFEK